MNDERKKCIFTNLPATTKLIISSSKHSWTKIVPCTKEFLESKKTNKLNDLEFKLIEIFFQKEIALLKVDYFENKMKEIRDLLSLDNSYKISMQDIEISIPQKNEALSLTENEEEDTITIVEDKNSFWE